jgi:hypothetical protein
MKLASKGLRALTESSLKVPATSDIVFPVIGAHALEFFETFRDPLYHDQAPEAIHCTLLMFAMICVHELAHVIFMHRSIERNVAKLRVGQPIDPEALFGD